MKTTVFHRLLFHGRNFRYRQLFAALKRVCGGKVLDVGGGYFFSTARNKGIAFDRWTIVEPAPAPAIEGSELAVADGCRLPFADGMFDTVLNVHVLEHVLDPLAMVAEVQRVLKRGGTAVFMIPQTAGLHMVPGHYCNFTPYWVREALAANGLSIQEHQMLGGVWSSAASQMVYLLLKIAGVGGYTSEEFRRTRSPIHYLLLPFMIPVAVALIPLFLVFSWGDLKEEANNHLVVARKA